ncbi:MAG: hypothetical protein ACXVH6_03850 [Halobacteriota archaeon]
MYKDAVFRNYSVSIRVYCREGESGYSAEVILYYGLNEDNQGRSPKLLFSKRNATELEHLLTESTEIFNAACTGSPNGSPEDEHGCIVTNHIDFLENCEMDADGRIGATLVERVKADDVELENVINEILKELSKNNSGKRCR